MADDGLPPPLRAVAARVGFGLAACLLLALFVALGTWQLERRAWKHDLLARIAARIHAAPEEAPGPAEWPALTEAADAYRRVSARGRFLHDRETLVQAVTERGAGHWVMTPLLRPDGTVLLINRGFVPAGWRGTAGGDRDPKEAGIVGLLRMSEPGGAFLRRNDPVAGRWYSRDVAAIAAVRGLDRAAPYFVDADAAPNPGGLPAGGLTVVAFADNHLVYALTWYGLALMVLVGVGLVLREGRHREN